CDPSGYGEGQIYLGSGFHMTDASGDVTFNETFAASVPAGYVVTATATNIVSGPGSNNTSEFSACMAVTGTAFNLVNNPGFETDADANNLPDGWTGKKLGASDRLDCTLAHEGRCSLM